MSTSPADALDLVRHLVRCEGWSIETAADAAGVDPIVAWVAVHGSADRPPLEWDPPEARWPTPAQPAALPALFGAPVPASGAHGPQLPDVYQPGAHTGTPHQTRGGTGRDGAASRKRVVDDEPHVSSADPPP